MTSQIDLMKLLRFMLKRVWLPIVCTVAGFVVMFVYAQWMVPDTYTSSATMYVYNANPNLVNFQSTDNGSLSAAVKLIDIYAVVVRSSKVLDAVAERLNFRVSVPDISKSLSISSVDGTSVMRISCTTRDPQQSMDICNTVVDVAPAEIIRVVSAGSVQVIDYATLPEEPNSHQVLRRSLIGALAGLGGAAALLVLLFLFNRRLTDSHELTENYKEPLLASIPRQHKQEERTGYLIGPDSPSQTLAAYAKLRMNILFAAEGRMRTLLVSSAVPGEGKSTIAANLAVSFSLDGERVLLIDCDMRKPKQALTFGLDDEQGGLSDLLVGLKGLDEVLCREVMPGLDVLPAGTLPPNPSELLHSPVMINLLRDMEAEYDHVLLDMPPINVLVDSLTLTGTDMGMLFITRCDYSDHREIRKALTSAEFARIKVLGLVMNCAHGSSEGYYSYRYYHRYYGYYDDQYHRHGKPAPSRATDDAEASAGEGPEEKTSVGTQSRRRRNSRGQ